MELRHDDPLVPPIGAALANRAAGSVGATPHHDLRDIRPLLVIATITRIGQVISREQRTLFGTLAGLLAEILSDELPLRPLRRVRRADLYLRGITASANLRLLLPDALHQEGETGH